LEDRVGGDEMRSRLMAFDSRSWEILGNTSNPELAQRNLLERDQMFTDRLVHSTKHLELPAIEVDTAMNENELAKQVTQAFRLTRILSSARERVVRMPCPG
jgi:hypothetical protein